MPTGQPSNTDPADPIEAKGADARDAADVAAVVSDDRMDDAPGGGGLMGAGAAGPLAGTAEGRSGAATPNSPIDAELPLDQETDGGEELAVREAQTRSLGDAPADE